MKVYLDLVFFINVVFDLFILSAVKLVLKSSSSWRQIVLGGVFGGCSIFLLFLSLSSLQLFIIKIIFSLILIFISFGRNNFFYNFIYFYLISISLGGFLYLLDISFTYQNSGVLFFDSNLGLNLLAFLVISPIFLFVVVKEKRRFKRMEGLIYSVVVVKNEKKYFLRGLLDTGNQLVDPYSKKCVLLINANVLIPCRKFYYIPFLALNKRGVVKACGVDYVLVDGKRFNCVLGFSKDKFAFSGVDCIIPNQFKEDL